VQLRPSTVNTGALADDDEELEELPSMDVTAKSSMRRDGFPRFCRRDTDRMLWFRVFVDVKACVVDRKGKSALRDVEIHAEHVSEKNRTLTKVRLIAASHN